MIEDFIPLGIQRPGFFGNGTRYQAKGRWREGNLVRFHEGAVGPIGGWVRRPTTGSAIVGVPTHAITWQLADGTPFTAVGTTEGLYVIDNDDVCYDITPADADIPDAPFDWHLSTFGAFLIASNSLRGDADLTLVNTYKWQGVPTDAAVPAWTSDVGPRGAYSVFATPERFLVVLRGEDPTTHTARTGVDGVYSERRSYWSSQETLDDFVSTDVNTGGDFDLQSDGRLVVGTATRGQSLIWSDVDLWAMNFIGGDLIYSFQNVGRQCGIVGKRAFVVLDKGAYWMGRGKFFVYDGFVRGLPCEVTDAVFNDFNESRAHTVWAFANPRFDEVTWFYPSAGAQYPNRYVTYNHVENHWVNGILDRTTGVPQRFRQDVVDEALPVMFDSVARMFEHESGNEREAQAWLASGPVELGLGERLMRIQGAMPDERISGQVQMRLYLSMASDALETLAGPYTLEPVTNLRHTARQARIRLEEVPGSAQADWRVGELKLLVRPAERRGVGPGVQDTTPASIEIVPTAITLISAQHFTFEAIIRNAAGEVLDRQPDSWHSDNATQVPIDTTGTVTADATPATAHITASLISPALTSNEATVTVIGDDVPVSLTISPASFDLVNTFTQQMTYEFRNAKGQILTNVVPDGWLSSDESNATVDSDGLVTAIDPGTTDITATLIDPPLTSNVATCTVKEAWVIHTFPQGTNAFVVDSGAGDVEVLLVGGGGSGGSVDGTSVCAGGGGAGEVVHRPAFAVTPGSYPVQVGVGGPPVHADHTIGGGVFGALTGNNGADSVFGSLTAFGGGAGGAGSTQPTEPDGFVYRNGRDGGSGGGGGSANDSFGSDLSGGASTASDGVGSGGGQGQNNSGSPAMSGGGGGGAGGAGAIGVNGGTASGGPGVLHDTASVIGTMVEYGRGGDSTCLGAINPQPAGSGNGGNASGGGEGLDGGSGADGTLIIKYKLSTGIVAHGGVKQEVNEP